MKLYCGIVVHEVRMTTMSPLVGGPVGAVAAGGGAELPMWFSPPDRAAARFRRGAWSASAPWFRESSGDWPWSDR